MQSFTLGASEATRLIRDRRLSCEELPPFLPRPHRGARASGEGVALPRPRSRRPARASWTSGPCRTGHAARIGRHEGSAAFLPEYLAAPHLLAVDLRARVETREVFDAAGLLAAYALAARCHPDFNALFGPRLDVVLTPAAPGEAPEGLHTTGEWIFNGIWTLLHVPCLAILAICGPRGLPVGIQLVGPRLSDARLLAIAEACALAIDSEPGWARETLCR